MIQEIKSREKWDAFMQSVKPMTFLQSWEWGQTQARHGEGVRYLGFFSGERQIGAALVLTVNAKRGRFLFIPHGPIFRSEVEARQYMPKLLHYCTDLAHQDNTVALRIAPLLIASHENTALFQKLGFRPSPLHTHAELTWLLDITKPLDVLLREMRKTSRHAIKKSQQAGVTTRISTDLADLENFWPLYETTKTRHGFIPFPRAFIKDEMALFAGKKRMFMVFAEYQNKVSAGALLVQDGDTVFYHHGASLKLPASVPASHLVQWTAIQEANRRGAKTYNFWGIAPDDKPRHPFAGITIFKKGFGGYPIDFMHSQDLPLTLGYWKLWLIEEWRKWKRGF